MTIDKKVDSGKVHEIIVKNNLAADLSAAIADVLKEYNIKGEYTFQVYRNDPIVKIKNIDLKFPEYAIGCGYSTVERPRNVYPL